MIRWSILDTIGFTTTKFMLGSSSPSPHACVQTLHCSPSILLCQCSSNSKTSSGDVSPQAQPGAIKKRRTAASGTKPNNDDTDDLPEDHQYRYAICASSKPWRPRRPFMRPHRDSPQRHCAMSPESTSHNMLIISLVPLFLDV